MNSDPTMQRDVGRLQADVQTVKDDLKSVKDDVREMRDLMQNVKGGWKLMLLLGTVSAALGAFMAKLLAFIPVALK